MDKLQEESRKQFEEWFNSRYSWKISPSMRATDGYMNNPRANGMWEAWQHSRASIVVELPDWHDYYENWMEETRNAIRSIGLSIKGE